MVTTGQDLRNERKQARVTQQEVADALGVPRYAIVSVERGDAGEYVDPTYAERYRAALEAISPRRRADVSTDSAKKGA